MAEVLAGRRWRRRLRRFWRRGFGRRRCVGKLVTAIDMEDKLQELVDRLKQAQRERLLSVILYGSAAAGEHNEHFSDLNVLCVLTRVTPAELAGRRTDLQMVARAGQSVAALVERRRTAHVHRLFPHRVSRHAGAAPRAVRTDLIQDLVIDRTFLSRAGGNGAAIQAAAPAAESSRSPVRTRPRCCA